MKTKTKHSAAKLAAILSAIVMASSAHSAVITSSNFSFGYGANAVDPNTWRLQAPSSSTVSGNFTFAPTVTGTVHSAAGPTFTNRILTTTTSASGSTYVGRSPGFGVTVDASWAGSLDELGVALENVRLTLIITEIRIYGLQYGNTASDYTLAFMETTPGFASTSTAVSLNKVAGANTNNLRPASNYTLLSWNPGDVYFDGVTSGSRSFELVLAGAPDGAVASIDGFEVFGYIEVSAIPEPSVASLMALSLGAVIVLRRRAACWVSQRHGEG